MTLSQIKSAIESGKRVFWKTRAYEVLKDPLRDGTFQWLIAYDHKGRNAHYIGLTYRDGVTMNGEELDFFSE